MTTLDESLRALVQVRYHLYELSKSGKMSKKEIRQIVRSATKHYPSVAELKRMLKPEYAEQLPPEPKMSWESDDK